MRQRNISGVVHPRGWRHVLLRGALFAVLGLFCLYYLIPLIVMISTSLKSLAEIREGTLLSLPSLSMLGPRPGSRRVSVCVATD